MAFAREEIQTSDRFYSGLDDIAKEVKGGFGCIIKTLAFGSTVKASDSPINPGNNLLNIPSYLFNFELRPDFYLDFRKLNLIFKPRFDVKWQRWEDGNRGGDSDTDDDLFVNEWIARLSLRNDLFISYGRENLQWGPSFLLSPSNPFFRDNGQSNPKQEVSGMDFARIVWMPGPLWTVSLIANTDEGRQDYQCDFRPAYAFKLDYTTYKKYMSLIVSHREGDHKGRLGAFAGWTVSDALLLYAETALFSGEDIFYPAQAVEEWMPEDSSFAVKDKDSLEGILLCGGSYTLEFGPTLTMEYIYNSPGYDDDEIELFYDVIDRVSGAFYSQDFLLSLSETGSVQSIVSSLGLLRKNYLMFQYQHSQIHNVLSLIFRYTYNIDDHSSRFIPIVECDVGDHSQVFLIGSQNFGSKEDEFRFLLDYSWMIGVEYTF